MPHAYVSTGHRVPREYISTGHLVASAYQHSIGPPTSRKAKLLCRRHLMPSPSASAPLSLSPSLALALLCHVPHPT
eukprot:2971590-Rhodomonas_salina.1